MHITTAADRLCAVLDGAAKEGREVEMWRLFGALTMEVRSSRLTMQAEPGFVPDGIALPMAAWRASTHMLSMLLVPVLTLDAGSSLAPS